MPRLRRRAARPGPAAAASRRTRAVIPALSGGPLRTKLTHSLKPRASRARLTFSVNAHRDARSRRRFNVGRVGLFLATSLPGGGGGHETGGAVEEAVQCQRTAVCPPAARPAPGAYTPSLSSST